MLGYSNNGRIANLSCIVKQDSLRIESFFILSHGDAPLPAQAASVHLLPMATRTRFSSVLSFFPFFYLLNRKQAPKLSIRFSEQATRKRRPLRHPELVTTLQSEGEV
ncbi:hypothetical protein [Holdemania sp. Marseille-P2844]|uniref:hypothetical protein n=1 Tax=Holdemania sp. Marseille-P2844 TaxID=1852366 RepID=UPI00111497A3|nr:hypothetical protein [Holdemania sp. Marseille-P2844]